MSLTNLRIASAMLLAALAFLPASAITTPVAAADDDIICFDYPMPGGGTEIECDTRGNYKAECKLTDPDNTSDFCQDVNSAAIWRANVIAASEDNNSSNETRTPKPSRTRN